MGALDARTDSFITMLLDVTGRVRPGDLLGVSEFDMPTVLQAYVDAHPERQLSIVNGALVETVAPPQPAPSPASAASQPVVAPEPAPDTVPAMADPLAAPVAEAFTPPVAEIAPVAPVAPEPPLAVPSAPEPAPAAIPELTGFETPVPAPPSAEPVAFEPGMAVPSAANALDAEPAYSSVPELVFQPLPVDDYAEAPPPPPSFDDGTDAPGTDPSTWYIAEESDLTLPEGLVAPPVDDPATAPAEGSDARPESNFEF